VYSAQCANVNLESLVLWQRALVQRALKSTPLTLTHGASAAGMHHGQPQKP
jgi:hypothetical protein